MREKYETLSLATLKELAKGRGMRGISTLKKGELIEAMLRQDEKDAANKDIRDTASAEGRQELRPQTNGSPSGETHNIRTSGNRTWNNPARRMNATPRPENAPERGSMWRVHSRMRIAPISQESEGYSGTIPSAVIMQGQAVRARFLRWPQMKSIPVKLLSQNRV